MDELEAIDDTDGSALGSEVLDAMRGNFDSQNFDLCLQAVSDLPVHGVTESAACLSAALGAKKCSNAQIVMNNFLRLKQRFQAAVDLVNGIRQDCDTVLLDVQRAKQETAALVGPIADLQSRAESIEQRSVVLGEFVAKYRLKPDELSVLQLEAHEAITDEFLAALGKAKRIRADAEQLSLSGCNTAGLSIMEQMAEVIDKAYDHLYRWIQSGESRHLSSDSVNVSRIFCQAYAILEDRPSLFKYSLEEYCTTRRLALIHSFVDALSKGVGSNEKPMDVYSHEPLRYIGGMLAWIHQAVMQERAVLLSLLKLCSETAVKDSLLTALSVISEGISRPFKIRAEQSLAASLGAVLAYQLYMIFAFYSTVIRQYLLASAELTCSLEDLKELSLKLFQSCLSSKVVSELKKVDGRRADLLPSVGLVQLMALVREILDCPSDVALNEEERKYNHQLIFTSVIDQLMHKLIACGTGMQPLDFAVYLLNSVDAITTTLTLYSHSERWLEMLQAQADSQVDLLTSENAGHVLNQLGLLQSYQEKGSAPPPPQTAFDGLYAAAAADLSPLFIGQWRRIASGKTRQTIAQRTIELLIAAYATLHDAYAGCATLQLVAPDQFRASTTSGNVPLS